MYFLDVSIVLFMLYRLTKEISFAMEYVLQLVHLNNQDIFPASLCCYVTYSRRDDNVNTMVTYLKL